LSTQAVKATPELFNAIEKQWENNVDKTKIHESNQPPQIKESQSKELDIDNAIKTLRKHAELYQSAGFTHISSLLR